MSNTNKLEQLKRMTTVVADTGDIEAIKAYSPMDATTNPSLVLKAALLPEYKDLLDRAVSEGSRQKGSRQELLTASADRLAVEIGTKILQVVPGRISTEVDSRLSFDTQASVTRAMEMIELYSNVGVSSDRVLIKLAATWEGIRAAEILQKDGINCNITLLFNFSQAAACADAGVYLISPFVGRILDWHKAKTGKTSYPADKDPGVQSVKQIFNYYKRHKYSTIVMGASFRSKEQIEQLAGCDRLTISPELLDELQNDFGELEQKLDAQNPAPSEPITLSGESQFRWALNEDAMATEKLSEGIRNFAADQRSLEELLDKSF